MPRPKTGRVMISVRLSPAGISAIGDLAKERKQTTSETIRAALRYAMEHTKEWA